MLLDSEKAKGLPDDGARSPASQLMLALLLLLPGALLYIGIVLLPAFGTLTASYNDYNLLSEPEFVGAANYAELVEDEVFPIAMGNSFVMVLGRLLVAAIVPPLIGVLVGAQAFAGRAVNRALLAGVAALIVPMGLFVLLRAFSLPLWGQTASPLPERWLDFQSPDGAARTVRSLDSALGLAIAMAVGGTAFAAVMRGRAVSASAARAGIGVWLLGMLIALGSLGQTFELVYTLTRGGPANSTITLPFKLYQDGFIRFSFGYASAEAVPLLMFSVFVGVLVWAVLVGFRLRLRFTPPAHAAEASRVMSFLSVPAILIVLIPLLGLTLWGVWQGFGSSDFRESGQLADITAAFGQSVLGPGLAIWLVQIPLTYLVGLALGFVRPVNYWVSNLLFLPFVILAFLPAEALMFKWFENVRGMEAIDTTIGMAYGFLVSPLSLIIFKLFFDGARENYSTARREGQTPTDAFLNTVLLPSIGVVLVAGATLTFIAASSGLWPLIVASSPEQFTMTTQLVRVMSQFSATGASTAGMATGIVLVLAVPFFVIFLLLHLLVLDRLAILGGPETAADLPKRKRAEETDGVEGF